MNGILSGLQDLLAPLVGPSTGNMETPNVQSGGTNLASSAKEGLAMEKPTSETDPPTKSVLDELQFSRLSDRLSVAKTWGAEIYKKVTETSESTANLLTEKLKFEDIGSQMKTVIDKLPAMREFQQIQTEFEAEQLAKKMPNTPLTDDPTLEAKDVLPWHPANSGLTDEALVEKLRSRILALSQHPNTFLLKLPEGAEGSEESGDMQAPEVVRLARAMLLEDPNLEKMRYQLVPSRINENLFWRNYFYRVSVERQSMQLSAMTGTNLEDTSDFVRVEPSSTFTRWDEEPQSDKANTPEANNKTSKSNRQTKSKGKKSAKSMISPEPKTPAEPPVSTLSVKELTEEELEAELAREVDEMVLIDSSPHSSESDQLDKELELELLAEMEPPEKDI